jgi:hypothetical protein
MKKILLIILGTIIITSTIITYVYARRGCCSWHGGVCGCSGSRILCCDGKLSPTCGCD